MGVSSPPVGPTTLYEVIVLTGAFFVTPPWIRGMLSAAAADVAGGWPRTKVLKPSFAILTHHQKKGTIITGQNCGAIVRGYLITGCGGDLNLDGSRNRHAILRRGDAPLVRAVI